MLLYFYTITIIITIAINFTDNKYKSKYRGKIPTVTTQLLLKQDRNNKKKRNINLKKKEIIENISKHFSRKVMQLDLIMYYIKVEWP